MANHYYKMAELSYNMANNYSDKRSQRKYIKPLRKGIEDRSEVQGIKITSSLPILFCRS